MEDWKEKYEDLFARIKTMADVQPPVTKAAIESHFPELKESEDELTWLTKYIEEEAYSLSMDIRDKEDRVKLKNLQRSLAWLEKKCEQKPAWSEEDGNHVKSILSTIECCKAQFLNSPAVVEAYNADVEWLKSIKGRMQPKQEWSEEDEITLNDALWCCEQAASIAKDDNDMGNIWYAENWLKSFKDRYTWKPSDLQIKALEYYIKIGCIDKEGFFGGELVKLLEELKKL